MIKRWRAILVLAIAASGLAFALGPRVGWRLHVVALKLTGELPDLKWRDVPSFLLPGSGVPLENLPSTRNPYWAVIAPGTSDDVARGREIFEARCASCHSSGFGEASDGRASGQLLHGVSDLALFQTIRNGVPGKMPASDLPAEVVWRLVAYLKHEMREGDPYRRTVGVAENGSPTHARVDVHEVDAGLLRRAADTGEWLTYSGSYDGQRHSPLDRIRRDNVSGLKLAWAFQFRSGPEPIEQTPIVVGRTMFVSLPNGAAWALDAVTGEARWSRPGRRIPRDLVTSVDGWAVNRGLAVHGRTLITTSLDAYLSALDVEDGHLLWRQQVADYRAGYTIVGAPLVADDRIIVGVAGGDRGLRGFLDAYSLKDGSRLWRFETVPPPGAPGHDTWGTSDAWQRGGGLTSVTGTYDPALGLVYWGVGNPSPAFQGDVRPGDNLYTSSVIALEAATGALKWYYQLSPHDERDWGATHVPVLVDAEIDGRMRPLLHLASRNGFLYTLDRTNGQFISAFPFAHQTWNAGFDENGRPRELPGSRPSVEGAFFYPGHGGATSWWSPSYDARTGTFYLMARNGYANVYYKSLRLSWPDGAYWGGRADHVDTHSTAELVAMSATTGDVRWRYTFEGEVGIWQGGVLSTDGDLVFSGHKGRFVAVDAQDGRELWSFNTGGEIAAAPITYLQGDRQYVAIAAGQSLFVFSL